MSLPDFQSLMLPVLDAVSNGREHRRRDLFERLARTLNLSAEDLAEVLPSGHPTFENRVRWAKWYLTKAGLIEATSHGVFRITKRGQAALSDRPPRIDLRFLREFSGIAEHERELTEWENAVETPDEKLAAIHRALKEALASELLDRVLDASSVFFERVVVDVLVAMGYGGSRQDAGKAIGRSHDGGIDGIIKEDKLGLDVVYIQAKRWPNTVGRPVVRAFAGSLEGHKARRGVLVTTSSFTKDALDFVDRIEKKIVLIDGPTLARFMIDHGVGVSDVETYVIKRLDEDYFEGEAVGTDSDQG